MRRNGFTLIEILTAVALLTAALGMIWAVWLGANETAEVLGKKANGTDATVHALAMITRELRATSPSQLSDLPGEAVRYRVPEDRDGNALPVDGQGAIEWGPVHRIGRDYDDRNNDGFTESQLVLERDEVVEVLANGLLPPAKDGESGRGIWFEEQDGGVLVTIEVASTTRRKLTVAARAVQLVVPRNP